ncbi:hypothetical protein LUZ63_009935 [Rhynchospora breviuscula]|uniref:DUF674 domain-containing protein n=1 Tax=Rhynchospora breviuscula TaxID=2022672 RepID=A0A9Q0HP55_9POAL|nr:hypothetical protein LUZ63_009935 [Rhynchospora breviuscula]
MTTQESEGQSAPKLQLKLLVDQKSNRVLFAEGGKEAVDFLLGLLRIPLGLVVHLLTGERTPGSLASIYSSIQNLDESYVILSNRDVLLNPRLPSISLPLLEPEPPAPVAPPPKKYYRCSGMVGPCRGSPLFMTDLGGMLCPNCRQPMVVEMRFLEKPKADEGEPGYVKGPITYLVMDDLSIMPMSTISAITMLKKFEVKDLSILCETTVEFGIKESLELLKASLQSTTVLTDVFISKPLVDIDRLQTT